MFGFIKSLSQNAQLKIFKAKKKTINNEPGVFTDTGNNPDNTFFPAEKGSGYESFFQNIFTLELKRKNIFAWIEKNGIPCKNFIFESVLSFNQADILIPSTPPSTNQSAGNYAYGFLFRYINESNYYSLLISENYYFRLDVYFNGTQIPLSGWIKIPEPSTEIEKNTVPVQIIASDTSFVIIINYQPAFIIDDDTIQNEGTIAFAGQNWNEYEQTAAGILFTSLDTRNEHADAAYHQWTMGDSISPEKHIETAESLAAVGRYIPSLIEIKKAWNGSEPKVPDLLLASRIYSAQKMYEEALDTAQKAVLLDSTSVSAAEQYASVLYMLSKMKDLHQFLVTNCTDDCTSPILHDLFGHCYANGAQYDKALIHYLKAAELNPEQPYHFENAALCAEKLNDEEHVFTYRFSAARLFLSSNQIDLFLLNLSMMQDAVKKSSDKQQKHHIHYLESMYEFQTGNAAKGLHTFHTWCRGLQQDTAHKDIFITALYHLYQNNQLEDLKKTAEKALQFYPDSAFILSMNAYAELHSGRTEKAAAHIEKALASDKDCADDRYIYVLNTAARVFTAAGMQDKACEAVYAAIACSPENIDVLETYAHYCAQYEKTAEALPVIEAAAVHSSEGNDYRARCFKAAAFLYETIDETHKALELYKKAVMLKPADTELLCRYAQCCLDCGEVHDADEAASRAYDIQSSGPSARIVSRTAFRLGDYVRAEVVLRDALGYEQGFEHVRLLGDLAHFYLFANKVNLIEPLIDELKTVISELKNEEIPDQSVLLDIEALEKEFFTRTKEEISCDKCGRTWIVPKDCEDVRPLRLTAEPPDDLPAGSCPECGHIYCIECAKDQLGEDGRFRCLSCDARLKLSHKGVIWLLMQWSSKNESN